MAQGGDMQVTVRGGRVSLPSGLAPPAARTVRMLQVALLAGTGYQLWQLIWPAGHGPVDQVLFDATLATGAALCLARSRLVRASRLAWACMGTSILVITLGDVYRTLRPGPFPIPAYIAFLLFYPLTYVALVLLVRERTRRLPLSTCLDGLVVGLALTTATSAAAYGPLAGQSGDSPVALIVEFSHPVGDLILLLITGSLLVLLGWRPEPIWVALTAGCLLISIADIAYLMQAATHSYRPGDRADSLWALSAAALAWAAWLHPTQVRNVRMDRWRGLVLPWGASISAVAMLVYGNVRSLPTITVVLATGTVAAAAVRLLIAYRELRSTALSREEAVTDDLTGLGNRQLLLRRLTDLLADGDRRHALLLVDLDRFKEVNDSLGHPTGDELLRLLAPRLAARALPDETVVRLGGDEFAVVVPNVDGPPAAVAAAERIATALDAPVTVGGVTLHVSASTGIALAPDHGREATTLLRRADVAMYHAKRTTAGRSVYRPSDDGNSRERLQTAADLRRALEHGEVLCHYQPQLDLRTGRVEGVEALVRWAHPTRGLLLPEHFLSLAEQTGLMRQITETALHAALADCREWEAGGVVLAVSVNLSANCILLPGLVDWVGNLLSEAGLATGRLVMEITEGTLLGDPEQVKVVLEELHDIGVAVSVDDYGVGYSSLSYLQQLPVDELKLDRQLVTPVTRDKRAAAIVSSTVDLAHALGVRLVAEGVEDWRSLGRLVELGCDRAQGYYIARPMQPAALPAWLRGWRYPQDTVHADCAAEGHLLSVVDPPYREASGG
jgi:diguanylate cyclase